jgi:hypothetical protein
MRRRRRTLLGLTLAGALLIIGTVPSLAAGRPTSIPSHHPDMRPSALAIQQAVHAQDWPGQKPLPKVTNIENPVPAGITPGFKPQPPLPMPQR